MSQDICSLRHFLADTQRHLRTLSLYSAPATVSVTALLKSCHSFIHSFIHPFTGVRACGLWSALPSWNL